MQMEHPTANAVYHSGQWIFHQKRVYKTWTAIFCIFRQCIILNSKGSNGTRRSSHQWAVRKELQVAGCTSPTSLQGTNFKVPCSCTFSGNSDCSWHYYWLTSFTSWFHCKQIRQLVFYCISHKVAAQGVPSVSHKCHQINQDWTLIHT